MDWLDFLNMKQKICFRWSFCRGYWVISCKRTSEWCHITILPVTWICRLKKSSTWQAVTSLLAQELAEAAQGECALLVEFRLQWHTLLGCIAKSDRGLLTFHRCLLHPSLLITLMMETPTITETSPDIYQTAWQNSPEEKNFWFIG